jgi:hypothetical protein
MRPRRRLQTKNIFRNLKTMLRELPGCLGLRVQAARQLNPLSLLVSYESQMSGNPSKWNSLGKMQDAPQGKPRGALGKKFDAGSGGCLVLCGKYV